MIKCQIERTTTGKRTVKWGERSAGRVYKERENKKEEERETESDQTSGKIRGRRRKGG